MGSCFKKLERPLGEIPLDVLVSGIVPFLDDYSSISCASKSCRRALLDKPCTYKPTEIFRILTNENNEHFTIDTNGSAPEDDGFHRVSFTLYHFDEIHVVCRTIATKRISGIAHGRIMRIPTRLPRFTMCVSTDGTAIGIVRMRRLNIYLSRYVAKGTHMTLDMSLVNVLRHFRTPLFKPLSYREKYFWRVMIHNNRVHVEDGMFPWRKGRRQIGSSSCFAEVQRAPVFYARDSSACIRITVDLLDLTSKDRTSPSGATASITTSSRHFHISNIKLPVPHLPATSVLWGSIEDSIEVAGIVKEDGSIVLNRCRSDGCVTVSTMYVIPIDCKSLRQTIVLFELYALQTIDHGP